MLNHHRVTARATVLIVGITLAVATSSSVTSAVRRPSNPAAHGRAAVNGGAYGSIAPAFIENRGQIDAAVRYYSQGTGYGFFLGPDEITLALLGDGTSEGVSLKLRFPGSNPASKLVGASRATGEVNYFQGSDPAGWHTRIPRYTDVAYQELWPGIDLQLRHESGRLKYELRVRPGARVSDIRFAYAGSRGLALDRDGALLVATALGTLRDAPPESYQVIGNQRVPVESKYALLESGGDSAAYGFALGAGYQPGRELVIDPGIEYSTFLGGSSHELGNGIKVDASGNAYIVGMTQSPNFPTTAGAFRRTGAASNFGDVFVTKLNATGTALVYSTFIGGNDFEWGRGIAVDTSGNAYVTGQTKSSSFPTTGGAFDRTFNVDTCPRCGIDQYDAFALKLNPTGSALVYSTFLGGFDIDDGMAIAVNSAGQAYVAGQTASSNFPTTAGAFDRTRNGIDTFVTKLNATGSALVYSTYLGGTAVQFPSRIAVAGSGEAYVTGSTSSTNFPVTAGAFDTTHNGAFDVYVTRLNAAGSALVYSTFLGGQDFDSAGSIVLDASGNALLSGSAGSVDFPTTPGAFDQTPDGSDGYIAKLNAAGSALIFSTVIGGSGSDGASGVGFDGAGNIWVTGGTGSVDFPITADAFDRSLNGGADAFISELNGTATTLLYSTYLGGTQSETGDDLAIDPANDVYVTGHTYSMDFPTTAGAFDTVFNGDTSIFWGDAFVTKLATDTGTSTPPSTPPTPAAPTLESPFNNDTPQQPITFHWADTPAAVSYTIQIDDSSSFAAPLVRSANVTVSQYVTSGLANVPHFWRVRAVNSVGVAGPFSAVRTFTPGASPPPSELSTMSTNPSTVVGGNASSATVVMSTPAPEGGALITLASNNPSVASVPTSVTVPGNTFTADFIINTTAVTANTTVTITAAYNGNTRTATVTVTPSGPPPPPNATLTSLALNPTSVTGGASSTGTITLSGAAPSGGAIVALSSTVPGIAAVPASTTVAAGTSTKTFTVSTAPVSSSTTVTITANYNGVSRSVDLTLTAGAPPPPPPQGATLTVTASGRSGERVTSSPAGINVSTGSTGSASFSTGTSITLSVTNGRDAIWSGACSSHGNKTRTCTFTINANASVTANVQ